MATILETITQLDAEIPADPDAVIWVKGTTPDGHKLDLWVVNDESGVGPLIWPGPSCLGAGGVYFNPLIVSVEETV